MKFIIIMLSSLTLLSCAQTSKQDVGMVSGAVIGGVAGSAIGRGQGRIVGGVLGAVVGGFLGSAIGKSMDDTDRLNAQLALERQRDNQPSVWVNPNNGNRYEVTPIRTYQPQPDRYCREFTSTVTIAGKKQQTYGTACRQPDGTWQQVESQPQ